ncbi:pyruvate dehydrogenase complex dihydrolipoamide acetyltransferase [Sandaracinus amylolyticus]|uniref:Acetyltransferase component of pyruvate dehydrogenase complex n=1 Tax=Sandaracinus amylolyticus TaxID=927083 RepID=A0A0F6W144_9BACT|nr:pyruvate dehydrogenase complex dihydrolipoamide acetyltransferase [Sandaracinus amylolyticus]AKF04767.1 Dihydrolipoamide acetyltransferase [Sandaracinus amylolyticus]
MAKIIGLPKLSPTMEEGTLARWAKKEGDAIGIDDLVAEIETDKATMEWRSFDKGVLLKVLAPEGATLKPEQPVAIFGNAGEDITALLAQVKSGAAAAAPSMPDAPKPEQPHSAPVAPGALTPSPNTPASTARPSTPPEQAPTAPPPVVQNGAQVTNGHDGRVRASPLVRALAREHDVDLRSVRGTGPGGRIIKRDVDEVLSRPKPAPAAEAKAPAAHVFVPLQTSFERHPPAEQPLTQMRKTIARRLVESKQNVPHFYLTIDVDADPINDARARMNAELEKSGEKVSVNDLLIKACAIALRRVPAVNRSFAGDKILQHQVVDISVAVAVPDGLLTPVVRDADRKGIVEIGREVRELAKKARDKKLKPEEMQGGTFSISNLGMFGIEDFSAVINPPEGAILAVGVVREEPVVKNGAVVPGRRMRMTMSCDHRVVDGAVGAEWLAALKKILEAPITMLM